MDQSADKRRQQEQHRQCYSPDLAAPRKEVAMSGLTVVVICHPIEPFQCKETLKRPHLPMQGPQEEHDRRPQVALKTVAGCFEHAEHAGRSAGASPAAPLYKSLERRGFRLAVGTGRAANFNASQRPRKGPLAFADQLLGLVRPCCLSLFTSNCERWATRVSSAGGLFDFSRRRPSSLPDGRSRA